MAFLTREQILAAPDEQREIVPVPEWGGEVMVRGLSGRGRDEMEAAVVMQNGRNTRVNHVNLRAKLLVRTVIDPESRQPLFNSNGDVKALGEKSAAALQRVFDVAQRLSGMTASDVEELTKNSASDQSDDSGSGSPSA